MTLIEFNSDEVQHPAFLQICRELGPVALECVFPSFRETTTLSPKFSKLIELLDRLWVESKCQSIVIVEEDLVAKALHFSLCKQNRGSFYFDSSSFAAEVTDSSICVILSFDAFERNFMTVFKHISSYRIVLYDVPSSARWPKLKSVFHQTNYSLYFLHAKGMSKLVSNLFATDPSSSLGKSQGSKKLLGLSLSKSSDSRDSAVFQFEVATSDLIDPIHFHHLLQEEKHDSDSVDIFCTEIIFSSSFQANLDSLILNCGMKFKDQRTFGILTVGNPHFGDGYNFPILDNEASDSVSLRSFPISLSHSYLSTLAHIQSSLYETFLRTSNGKGFLSMQNFKRMYLICPFKNRSVDYELIDIVQKQSVNSLATSLIETLSHSITDTSFITAARIARSYLTAEIDMEETDDFTSIVYAALKSMVIITPYNNCHYFCNAVHSDKTPSDKLDPKMKETYESYFSRKYHLKVQDQGQPLLEVYMKGLPFLNPRPRQLKELREKICSHTTFLIPEFVQVSPIPARTLHMLRQLPYVLHCFERVLIAKSCRLEIGFPESPKTELVVEALTAPILNSGISYERLETLGDSFLKLTSSIDVFVQFPYHNEGKLSHTRSTIICNANLTSVSNDLRLGRFVDAKGFASKFWFPPIDPTMICIEKFVVPDTEEYQCLANEMMREISIQTLGVKTTADVVEALIGACILGSDVETTVEFMRRLGLLKLTVSDWVAHGQALKDAVTPDSERIFVWTAVEKKQSSDDSVWLANPKGAVLEYCSKKSFAKPEIIPEKVADVPEPKFKVRVRLRIDSDTTLEAESEGKRIKFAERDAFSSICQQIFGQKKLEYSSSQRLTLDFAEVERAIGYTFSNIALLKQTFTHQSRSISLSYERLEFLGDAVLDWIITFKIFSKELHFSPEHITALRSRIVNNRTLSFLAVRLNLHEFFLRQYPEFHELLDPWIPTLSCMSDSRMIGADGCPRVLADLLEALVAAVFIDSGFSLEPVHNVFGASLNELYDWIIQSDLLNFPQQA